MSFDELRRDYARGALARADLAADPVAQFAAWFDDARGGGLDLPDAMTLATVDDAGAPDARIVVLRGFDADGFVFYTNLHSAKANQLTATPRAALVFFWPALERQVRLRGTIGPVDREQAERYFGSRPRASQLAAQASPQSEPLPDRAELDARAAEAGRRFADDDVPTPDHWGGFRLSPETFEFWQGRADRLHDRFVYARASGGWQITRLAP